MTLYGGMTRIYPISHPLVVPSSVPPCLPHSPPFHLIAGGLPAEPILVNGGVPAAADFGERQSNRTQPAQPLDENRRSVRCALRWKEIV
jgi:hypothetical protein